MPHSSAESDLRDTPQSNPQNDTAASVRIDRWLWAARFFKTRSLAKSAIEGGKVQVGGKRVKPSKEIRVGQALSVRRGPAEQQVVVLRLSDKRGPAKVACTLYEETAESIELRERQRAQRSMERAGLQVPSQKPSKKQRRDIRKLKSNPAPDNP